MITLRSSDPVARKEHRCDWCFGTIAVREQYRRATNIGYDGIYEWVSCMPCEGIASDVWYWSGQPDEGMDADTFEEWARQHVDHPTIGVHARAYLSRRASIKHGLTRQLGREDDAEGLFDASR